MAKSALAPLTIVFTLVACQEREHEAPTAPEPAVTAAIAPKPRARPQLPEDPELAAKSSAQWEEHLREEEEHRQLCYDRDRLPQHRSVMAQLTAMRQRYDGAKSEAALASARAQVNQRAPALRKTLDEIDPWKNSSRALPEQEAILNLLVQSYPDARLAALRGTARADESVAAELDRRTIAIGQTLGRAEKCKDE